MDLFKLLFEDYIKFRILTLVIFSQEKKMEQLILLLPYLIIATFADGVRPGKSRDKCRF